MTFGKFILKYRVLFLVILIGGTLWMGYFSMNVPMSYSPARILPSKDSTWADYEKFKNLFGEDAGVVIMGARIPHFFEPEFFNSFLSFCDSLEKIPGVSRMISIPYSVGPVRNDSLQKFDVQPLMTTRPATKEELIELEKKIWATPFYDGLLWNAKDKIFLILVQIDKNILNKYQRMTCVKSIKKHLEELGTLPNITYLNGGGA